MLEFLSANSSVVIATFSTIIGAIIGATTTVMASYFVKRREFSLKLREALIQKRIDAHEALIKIANEMRKGNLIRANLSHERSYDHPEMLYSKELFDQWKNKIYDNYDSLYPWLGRSAKRELYLVNTYVRYLDTLMPESIKDFQVYRIGTFINADLRDMGELLSNSASRFFSKEMGKLSIGNFSSIPDNDIKYMKAKIYEYDLSRHREDIVEFARLD